MKDIAAELLALARQAESTAFGRMASFHRQAFKDMAGDLRALASRLSAPVQSDGFVMVPREDNRPTSGVVYQCMVTDEDDRPNGPKDLWADVSEETFAKLSKRDDVRSRILYTTPPPAVASAPEVPEGDRTEGAT